MTTGGGWVWIRGSGPLLARLDPRTNKIVETYGPESGSGAAIVGYGAAGSPPTTSKPSGGFHYRLPRLTISQH